MIVWFGVRWENACEWVHPCTRADEVLVIIYACDISIGTARAQLITGHARRARVACAADELFQCEKRMFHPRLPNLFEALGVVGAAAHTVKILCKDRAISVRERTPVDWPVDVVDRT